METNKLISKIYINYYDMSKIIYAYFNKHYIPETMDEQRFTEICEKNFVHINPTILFDFLELNNVKLGIMPKFANTSQYEYQVLYGNTLRHGSDCASRKEAEYRVILASLDLLNDAMTSGKIIKYIK